MTASEKVLIRLRTDGAKQTQRDMDGTGRSARRLGRDIDDAGNSSRRTFRSFGMLRTSARGVSGSFGIVARGAAGAAAALGGVYGIIAGGRFAFQEATEAAKVGAATVQVIRTTGRAAKVSARFVGELSSAISTYAGIDDEAIQSGANLLLTFTNIRNEAGKGNKVFSRATRLMTDMSVALGTDQRAAAQMLGKALNDPVRGYSRLMRSGVSFTDQQIKQIKTMQDAGDTLGAQKVILDEVAREFGGQARAQAQPLEKLNVAIGNIAETAGMVLLPIVNRTIGPLTRWLNRLNESGRIEQTLGVLGRVARDVGGAVDEWLVPAAKAALDLFRALPGPAKAAVGALALVALAFTGGPLSIAAGAVAAFVLIHKHWDTFVVFFEGVWAKLKDAAGIALRWVGDQFGMTGDDAKQTWQAIVTAATLAFSMLKARLTPVLAVLKVLFEHVLLPAAKRVFGGIVTAMQGAARMIGGIVKTLSGLLTGDFSKAWEGIKQIFSGASTYLIGIFQAVTGPARTAIEAIWRGLDASAGAVFGAIKTAFETAINGAITIINAAIGGYMALPAPLRAAGDLTALPYVGAKGEDLLNQAASNMPNPTGRGPAQILSDLRANNRSANPIVITPTTQTTPMRRGRGRDVQVRIDMDGRQVGRAVGRNIDDDDQWSR